MTAKMVWTEEMDKQAQWVPLDQLENRVFKVSQVRKVTREIEVSEANLEETDSKELQDQQDHKVKSDHKVFKGLQVKMVKTET